MNKKLFLLVFLGLGCAETNKKEIVYSYVENVNVKLTIDGKECEVVVYCAARVDHEKGDAYFSMNRYVVNLPEGYYLCHNEYGLRENTLALVTRSHPMKKYDKFGIYHNKNKLVEFDLPVYGYTK